MKRNYLWLIIGMVCLLAGFKLDGRNDFDAIRKEFINPGYWTKRITCGECVIEKDYCGNRAG